MASLLVQPVTKTRMVTPPVQPIVKTSLISPSSSRLFQKILKRSQPLQVVEDEVRFQDEKKIKVLVRWFPPPFGIFKLNTDGAMRSSVNLATSGGLIRNWDGKWITGFAYNIGGSRTPFEAELWGLFIGLRLAADKGILYLEVETDSAVALNMVQYDLQKEKHVRGELLNLLQSIQQLLNRFRCVELHHAYREANRSADWLANFAFGMEVGTPQLLMEPPASLVHILSEDSNGQTFPRLVPL